MNRNADKATIMVDRLNHAIRQNPLAAGLIGAGLFMTLFGSTRLPWLAARVPGAAADAVRSAAGAVADTIVAGGRSVSAGVAAAGEGIAGAAAALSDGATAAARHNFGGETLARHSRQVGEAIGSGATELADRASSTARSGMEAGRALQGQLAEQFERQPLLLGAVGLAIGAGIASVLPATETEREWVGEQAAALRKDVERRATQVLGDVKQEATARGLTPSGAKDTLDDMARKAKNIAGSARDAVSNRVS